MKKIRSILSLFLIMIMICTINSIALGSTTSESLVPKSEQGYQVDVYTGDIAPMASNTFPGAYTSDMTYFPTSNAPEEHIEKGLCYINSTCESKDFITDLLYCTFSGYGSTQWQGSGTAKSTVAKVTVRSNGIAPSISTNGGVTWGALGAGPVTVATKTASSNNLAKANYSNVMIRSLGTFTIIFETSSKIDINSTTSYNASEDTWWWN